MTAIRGVGVDDERDGRPPPAAACRRRCRCRRSCAARSMPCSSAQSRTAASLPALHTNGPTSRSVVGAVVVDAVLRGDDVVETEEICERLHHVVGRGRGHHDRPPGGAVLLEQRCGERLDHLDQSLGCNRRGRLNSDLWLALRECDRLSGERHRRQRLADRVEQLEQQGLAGDRAVDQPRRLHRLREHLAGRTGQQRAVEIEERCPHGAGRSRVGHQRDCTPKRERPRLGEAGSLNQNPVIGGTTFGGFFRTEPLGVGTVRLHVKVCT